jgi:hypothetical protein
MQTTGIRCKKKTANNKDWNAKRKLPTTGIEFTA